MLTQGAHKVVFARALKAAFIGLVLATSITSLDSAHALSPTRVPDFYAEPGRNAFRDQLYANVTETIDPLSGNLSLSYVDLLVPGNGGFDIKVRRNYNANSVRVPQFQSPQNLVMADRTPFGMGWTMHFGRVLKVFDQERNWTMGCQDPWMNGQNNQLDNATLETPEGGAQTLHPNGSSFAGPALVTKNNWVAYCRSDGGIDVVSPEGTRYEMTEQRQGSVEGGGLTVTMHAWYPRRITDRNGNYITIQYLATGNVSTGKEALPQTIQTSDGRTVTFSYTATTSADNIRLASITANGQTTSYTYTLMSGSTRNYLLTRVTMPAGLQWNYTYHNFTAGQAGDKLLQRVTYPFGATVNYNYMWVCFNYPCSGAPQAQVVSSKVNGGRDVAAGTWTFSYSPSTTEDVTTVTFPGGSHVYRHFGSRGVVFGGDIPGRSLWKIGLLRQKEIYNGSTQIRRETYTWESLNRISTEEYYHPYYDGSSGSPQARDSAVWAPVMTRKDVVQDGSTYVTTYSNFDAHYRPQTVAESGQANRTTTVTYFPRNANQNIVNLVKDEVLAGQAANKSIYRTFDGNGNLAQLTRHGVVENYTYHGTGDVATRRNERNFTWTYSNHYRGIPRNEQHPEGVALARGVNATGTVAWEDNGRGYRTSYGYDGLNRLASITPPRGSVIGIGWSTTGKTVTRGGYSQATTFDGFGRPSFTNTNGITQDINYNALGFKSFESLPGSASGTSYSTDVLGRVTSASHPDSTSRGFTYSQNRVTVRNERNYNTTHTYRSFGNPDEKVLMRIDAPEGVVTQFDRDIIGLPNWVSQGGFTRSFTYDGRNFLQTETHPETGTTTYGRDAVGNMTSRQVGSSGTTTYGYDGLNRLRTIDHPGTTPDVTLNYDNNNNLTLVDNGVARHDYPNYDANDNLIAETLTVGSFNFAAAYAYDNLDYLSTITYPSLRQVSYAPDVLGRPTTVAPFITSASHHPNGVPASLNYANGHAASIAINGNNRQWISQIVASRAGTGYTMDLSYGGYDGVGNVGSITNALDVGDSKSMSYDGIDRLLTAGNASMSYDTVGNIRSMTTSAGSLTYNYGASNNRLESISGYRGFSFGYDAYGNISGNGRNTFTYDDAGALRGVGGTTSATYDYDGKNLRVRTQTGTQTSYLLYGLNGLLLGEYDSTGTWKKEYAYLGSKLVATVENVPDAAPGTPSSIAVPASNNTGGYTINWSAATSNGTPITRYELEEATSSAFTSPTVVYSGLNLSAAVSGKSNGTYYYRVRACSGTACGNFVAGANGVVVDTSPPSAPGSISVPTLSSTGTYPISWGVATGTVLSYELEESTAPDFCYVPPCPPGEYCTQPCTKPPTVYNGLNLSTTIGNTFPKSSGTYYYRVRACNGAGCSNYREGANGTTVTVEGPPPR